MSSSVCPYNYYDFAEKGPAKTKTTTLVLLRWFFSKIAVDTYKRSVTYSCIFLTLFLNRIACRFQTAKSRILFPKSEQNDTVTLFSTEIPHGQHSH